MYKILKNIKKQKELSYDRRGLLSVFRQQTAGTGFLHAMLKDPIQSQMKDLAERLQVPASHVQVYKKRLIDAGIIRQVSRGIIRYDVPMLREYLTENCEES